MLLYTESDNIMGNLILFSVISILGLIRLVIKLGFKKDFVALDIFTTLCMSTLILSAILCCIFSIPKTNIDDLYLNIVLIIGSIFCVTDVIVTLKEDRSESGIIISIIELIMSIILFWLGFLEILSIIK